MLPSFFRIHLSHIPLVTYEQNTAENSAELYYLGQLQSGKTTLSKVTFSGTQVGKVLSAATLQYCTSNIADALLLTSLC